MTSHSTELSTRLHQFDPTVKTREAHCSESTQIMS